MSDKGKPTPVRVLALIMAALLVAGLVPALPEAPSALAQGTDDAIELGGENRPSGEDNGDGVISVVGDGAGEGTEAAGPEAREGVGADSAGRDEDAMFATQAVSVSNPQVRADSSMAAGQVATWDCVWFGSYPQTEITSDDTVYFRLQNASWDANGDVMIDNTKYRRISSSDTIYSGYWSDDGYGYEAYRYFRYDPIKWRVLGISGSDALVVADKALDDQGYNTYNTDVTWATSSVRSWLNGYGAASNQPGTDYSLRSFLGTAFSSGERSAILTTDVVNADSTYYGTAGGAGTRDRVFLLSEAEVCGTAHGFASGYSTYDESRRCMPTDFAHAMGVYRYSGGLYDGNCWWWLRSPGATSSAASCVSYVGSVPIGGYGVTPQFHAVRPALNLNLASGYVTWAGTVSSDGTVDERPAPNEPHVDALEGMCGPNLKWTYANGALAISMVSQGGSGEMTSCPWNTTYDLNGRITSVLLPNGITSIAEAAFASCAHLSSISLPASLGAIGQGAFANCTSLTSVELPTNLKELADMSFLHCSSLAAVKLGTNLETIGSGAFMGCTAMKTVDLPTALKLIKAHAFDGCAGLERLGISFLLQEIEASAFYGCTSLRQVDYAASQTAWDKIRIARTGNEPLLSITPNCAIDENNIADSKVRITNMSTAPYSKVGYDVFKVATVDDYPYTPYIESVRYQDDVELTQGKDYVVSAVNNGGPGTASLVLRGINDYHGTKVVDYTIEEGFLIGRDTANFSHANREVDSQGKEYYRPGFLGVKDYRIDREYYDDLVSDAERGEKDNIKREIQKSWDGDCEGLSSLMALAYRGVLSLPDISSSEAKCFHDLPEPSKDGKLLNNIRYLYLAQHLKHTGNATVKASFNTDCWEGYRNLLMDATGNDSLKGTLRAIAENRDTMLLRYFWEEKGSGSFGHSVVLTGDVVEKNGCYHVCYYDIDSIREGKNHASYMEISTDFNSFSLSYGKVTKSNYVYLKLCDVTRGRIPFRHDGLSGQGDPEAKEGDRTCLVFSLNKPLSISTEGGGHLGWDGKAFDGDLKVLDADVIVRDSDAAVRLEIERRNEIRVEPRGGGVDVAIYDDANYAAIESDSVASAVVSMGEEVEVDAGGEFTVAVSTKGTDGRGGEGLIEYKGSASGRVTVHSCEGYATVEGDSGISSLTSSRYAGCEREDSRVTSVDPGRVVVSHADGKVSNLIDISNADVAIEGESFAYTGKAIKPGLMVTLNGNVLACGSDYTLAYSNNRSVGLASVTVTGAGGYFGTKTVTFRIVSTQPSITPSFSDVTDEVAHHEDISWLASTGISKGWDMPDGTVQFRPYANVARADMAAFLFRLAKSWGIVDDSWQPKGGSAFADVTAATPHYREVMWLAESGISKGWDVGGGRKEFRPYADVARADMAAFLHRLAQRAAINGSSGGGVSFRDVTTKTAHAEDIAWLAATGVSKGWDVEGGKKEFRPLANVARADMAAFLHRLDGLRYQGGQGM